MRNFSALDFASCVGLRPSEVFYTGTGSEGLLSIWINVHEALAISSTLFDFVDPVIVYSTGTGIVTESN